MDDKELVTPYCGGCGHLYFNSPKVSLEEAKEQAKTLRCHYCLDDERVGKQRSQEKPKKPLSRQEKLYEDAKLDCIGDIY